MSEPTYEDYLAVDKALQDAEVPVNDRFMYYYRLSWWRHPIKRYKQKRFYRHILTTMDNAPKSGKKIK